VYSGELPLAGDTMNDTEVVGKDHQDTGQKIFISLWKKTYSTCPQTEDWRIFTGQGIAGEHSADFQRAV